MRALIAFDKFKDSMTAARACETAARAIALR
jgi:glycerate kinase